MQYWDEDLKKFVNVSKSKPLPTVNIQAPEPATTESAQESGKGE